MQIILSAVLYKDNLSLISILLCLYFHQGFTELAHPELLATTGHLRTATKAGRAHQAKFRGREPQKWSLRSTYNWRVTHRYQSLEWGGVGREEAKVRADRLERERTRGNCHQVTPRTTVWETEPEIISRTLNLTQLSYSSLNKGEGSHKRLEV